MGSKAQISAEFFIFVGLAFLIAIAFEIASIKQLHDFNLQREDDAVKDVASKLQKEILLASYVEDGYIRTFTIPDKIENINYTVFMQNSTVIVQSKNSVAILPIPNAAGNFTKGTNKINKTDGVIHVN